MSAWGRNDDAVMLDYGLVPVREMARRLGRPIGQVYDRARVLGLVRNHRGGAPYATKMRPTTGSKQ